MRDDKLPLNFAKMPSLNNIKCQNDLSLPAFAFCAQSSRVTSPLSRGVYDCSR